MQWDFKFQPIDKVFVLTKSRFPIPLLTLNEIIFLYVSNKIFKVEAVLYKVEEFVKLV